MKRVKFRIIEYSGKSIFYVQIKNFLGIWKYLKQITGSNAGYTWKVPIKFSTREAAINHVKFHQDRSKGRFHEFIEYPGLKIS